MKLYRSALHLIIVLCVLTSFQACKAKKMVQKPAAPKTGAPPPAAEQQTKPVPETAPPSAAI